MVKEYVAYLCPDGSVILDWGSTLSRIGYPAYPKHKCVEIERGLSEGGKALVKIHSRLKEATRCL